MTNLTSLCVYCGSTFGDDPRFEATATKIGELAAERGVRIVYGGGGVGLMGAVARSARDKGGEVYGVIPKFLLDKEGVVEGVKHDVVETMHERKMLMFEAADAFCVLPGGIGTLEEVIETLSWSRLDLHKKPVILANLDGFWSPLCDLMTHIVERKFAPDWFGDCFHVATTAEQVFEVAETHLRGKDTPRALAQRSSV